MKHILIAASAAIALSACSTTMGEDTAARGTAGSMAMPTQSAAYMEMAHSSDMFEIESSRMALQMSRNEAVRSFAQMMIADHTRMMNEMMAMAGPMGVNMGSMPMTPKHMAMLERLRGASAANFDMMYKREQVMAHEEALMLHRTYAKGGDNPALRAMAAKAVPMVAADLTRARGLPGRM